MIDTLNQLIGDASLLRSLLPEVEGPIEIYVITFLDDSGRFYLGQHQLPHNQECDLEYFGSGKRLKGMENLPQVKTQLLRLPESWANLVEELLVMKYRQLYKPLCLNASIKQTRFWAHQGRM